MKTNGITILKMQSPDSDYTTIGVGLVWDTWSPDIPLGELSTGDKVDFKVQSQIGYFGLRENRLVPMGYSINYDDLHGEASEWSTEQTFVMTGTPEPTPTVPEFPVIAFLPILVVMTLVATVLLRKKKVEA